MAADHARVWATDQTLSDPRKAVKLLHRNRINSIRTAPEPDVQVRDLGDYDTALGIDLGGEVAG